MRVLTVLSNCHEGKPTHVVPEHVRVESVVDTTTKN